MPGKLNVACKHVVIGLLVIEDEVCGLKMLQSASFVSGDMDYQCSWGSKRLLQLLLGQ